MVMRLSALLVTLVMVILLSLGVLSLTEKQIPSGLMVGKEISSPSDWVKENQIKVYPDSVILNIPQSSWASFTDTNSMDPFIDAGANAIQIKPLPGQVGVGDVIAYHSTSGTIIHRVIERGIDENGIFYLVKGDNNASPDSMKVRDNDIVGVVVAVVY